MTTAGDARERALKLWGYAQCYGPPDATTVGYTQHAGVNPLSQTHPREPVICAAIRDCMLLEFDYDGLHRVVAPYCHGSTGNGEVLRAVQVRGASHSRGLGFGKLWMVKKMLNIHPTLEPFVPDDPHYNPDDSAMVDIHCRARRYDLESCLLEGLRSGDAKPLGRADFARARAFVRELATKKLAKGK